MDKNENICIVKSPLSVKEILKSWILFAYVKKISTFGRLPWLFMPHNIATHKSQFPRSYCHPTQPILQLRSHILLKIRLRLLYNHTHLLTYEQAPSERKCDYMIDKIYLFQQNMLACLRMCVFFCTFARYFGEVYADTSSHTQLCTDFPLGYRFP